jgi:hypothetical protein
VKDASLSDLDLNKQIDALKSVAAEARDSWLKAKCIALTDERVRAAILEKLRRGFAFEGIEYLEREATADDRRLRFDFEFKPEISSRDEASFLAIVNIAKGNVASIVDPYRSTD